MLPVSLRGVGALRSVELWEAKTTLLRPVTASHGTHSQKAVLYVRILSDEAEGWGEVGALESPVGTDPPLASVAAHLEMVWFPRLINASARRGGSCPESQTISMLGSGSPLDNVASAGIEMALMDAELRLAGASLCQWLSVEASSVPFGAILGIPENGDVGELVDRAQILVEQGATRIRIKIRPGFSYEPLEALRSSLGNLDLHGDANGSFDAPVLTDPLIGELASLDVLELRCIEQPLSTNDLTEYAKLSEILETPVCLDEGLSSVRRCTYAIRYKACRSFCVKPARLGGLRAALSVLDRAFAAGAECFLGGMFETGLGRASLGALAAHPAASLISDVSAPVTYLTEDPCGLEGPHGPRQDLWARPGVGPPPKMSLVRLRAELSMFGV